MPVLLLCSTNLPAATNDTQPILLEASRMEIDKKSGQSIYQGNVILTKGAVTINADSMTVIKQGEDLDRIIAKGKPVTFVQLPGEDRKSVRGQANTIEYNAKEKLIVLTENAELWQEKDRFKGELIQYDIERELVKAGTSESSPERVKVTIHPKKENKE